MQIRINGERREVADGATVQAVLDELQFKAAGTVVERNGEVVDRAAYGEAALQEGDRLELVRFVGGG
jgi:thiamine biosynthesis protein ThiS